ncbi:MAG: hypothetical protein ABSA83_08200 [Verrucomicrobiota bacterium]|jgi:hypothetical protein
MKTNLFKPGILAVALVALACSCPVVQAQNMIIYSNALVNGWGNWGWATLNYTNTSPVYTGCTYSISVTMTAWQGIQIVNTEMPDSPYSSISFWLNGGASGGQHLQMYGLEQVGSSQVQSAGIDVALTTPVANTWVQYTVTLSSLGVANITNFTGFVIQDSAGTSESTFYLDNIQLNGTEAPVAGTPTVSPASSVYPGTTVTLTESAAGAGTLHYQWQTDGGAGGSLTNIPGATGSNLMETLNALGSYNFDVIVSNSYGTNKSSEALLTVLPPVSVTINATNVISTVQNDAFGMFMAVWDAWGAGTAAPLKQAGVTALRYPGGSYADIYHWSSYLSSPIDGETTNLGYLSGSTTLPDFINLCSNAQAQAVISVDWGSGFLWNAGKTAMAVPATNGTPQEAAAWVAYCNASRNIYGTTNDVTIGVDAEGNNWQTAGYWAHLRASTPLGTDDGSNFLRMNHPVPVGIKYWEIGNEPYGDGYYGGGNDWELDYAVAYPYTTYPRYTNALLSPAAYGQAVKAFSIAMKAVDPTIKVGAYSSTPPGDYSWDYINGVNNGQHWTPQALAQCGSNIDFVIVHWYPSSSDETGTDLLAQVGSTIPVMIDGTGPYPHTGTNSGLEDWITNYCPNPGNVQIAVTEFGAGSAALANNIGTVPILGPVEALFWADCMSTWLNYPAFANADWLDYDSDSFLGSGSNGPVVYAMQMLRHLCNPGDAFVKATSDTTTLRVQAAARQDGNLGILLINESMNISQSVNLTISNANLDATGTVYQFGTNNWSGTDYTSEVPSSGPSSNSISSVGNNFSVTLPAYTMDVLVIPVLSNTPPVLAAISNYTVNVGQTVAFTASATDSNQPPPTLTFSLSSAPANASLAQINNTNAAFSLRPSVSQASSTIPISLSVKDNGTPPLSATDTFSVIVNPIISPTLSAFAANPANGNFSLTVSGMAGPDYAVLYSTNLLNWSTIFETNSPPLPFTWVDTNVSLTNPASYYHVILGAPLQ